MQILQKLAKIIVLVVSFFLFTSPVLAQTLDDPSITSEVLNASSSATEAAMLDNVPIIEEPAAPQFYKAVVLEITKQEETIEGGYTSTLQIVKIKLETSEEQLAVYSLPLGSNNQRLLKVGDKIIVNRYGISLPTNDGLENFEYVVTDLYRFPSLVFVLIVFLVVIVVFSGMGGLRALGGLGMTVALLLYFVVPQIAQGANPLVISFVGSLLIACLSLYLAHGLNRRTTIALVSTLGTLCLALITAISFVSLTKLFGLGTEESIELQYGALTGINLRGLLLAGMIIGALGVLDDITTAQAAAVEEIYKANPKVQFADLYQRGMSVGREHITSLVNTLALAYAGTSLPMLLLFTVYQQPLWVTLNSEFVIEEVVRTVVGSLALALAVPITTGLAAWYFTKKK